MSWLTKSFSNDILFNSKTVLKYTGLNPMHQNGFTKFLVAGYISLIPFFIALTVLRFVNVVDNLTDVTLTLESFSAYLHYIGKLSALILNQNLLRLLFKTSSEKFWKINRFGSDVEQDCKYVIKRHNLITNLNLLTGHITTFIFVLGALLSTTGEGALLIYIPENWPSHMLLYVESALVLFMAQIMLISDVLFVSLCTEAMIQFKLLAHELRNLNFFNNTVEKKLKECIAHHNLILRFTMDIGDMVTITFFTQFCVVTIATCMELYMLLETEIVFYDVIRAISYLMTITCELFLYCATADILAEEIDNVLVAAYSSNWYENINPKIHRNFILLMSRNQKQKAIVAGGVLSINMFSFLKIFKLAFSFFTFMKAVTME